MKYSKEIIKKVKKELKENKSAKAVAEKYGVGYQTVLRWKKDARGAECRDRRPRRSDDLNEKTVAGGEEKFEEEMFLDKTSTILADSTELLASRMRRALLNEGELDRLIEIVSAAELSASEKKSIVNTLKSLQLPGIKDISSILNALYEKQSAAYGKKKTDGEGVFEVKITVVD